MLCLVEMTKIQCVLQNAFTEKRVYVKHEKKNSTFEEMQLARGCIQVKTHNSNSFETA